MPLTTFAHTPTLAVRAASPALQAFTKEHFSQGAGRTCAVRALEAGGGGDCLFHSVATILELMVQQNHEAAQHVLARIPLDVLTGTKSRAVRHLRELSASTMTRWPPEVFLDYVLCRVMDQRLGSFQDAWNPQELLQQAGFGELLHCESVLAFGDAPDGDPGDITMRCSFNDARAGGSAQERLINVRQGQTFLADLRAMVQQELMTNGNNHWGDQFDVQNLSDALDLGILLFCDQLQLDGQQCFYNIGSQRENYPYWVCLWWDEPRHFRVAQVSWEPRRTPDGHGHHLADGFTSFWSETDLPRVLREHYRECNRLAN